jgi:phytoene dehydrogenase-like protein
VLERREVIGGAAVTEEVVPGFRFSVFSYLMSLLHPKVIDDLDLRAHRFAVLPASDMFSPLPNGDHILFADSIAKTQASFSRFSKKDANIYPEFDRYLMDSANIVRKLLLETPPDPSCRDWRAFRGSAKFLWKYRKIGGKFFRLIDLMTMSADAYLSEWFEDTHVKATLAYYSGIGTFAGPKTPGSAYVIMHHVMGEHAGAGGWGSCGAAWARSPRRSPRRAAPKGWRSALARTWRRSTRRAGARPAWRSRTARGSRPAWWRAMSAPS